MKKKENNKKYGYIKIEIPIYPESKEVYCKDCEYFIDINLDSVGYIRSVEHCNNSEINHREIVTWKERSIVEAYPQELNIDNNCSHFKRKYERKNQTD